MRAINKLIATTVFLIVIIVLGFHIFQTQNSQALEKEIKSNVNEVVLRIEGMTCKVCSIKIQKALNKLNGVYLMCLLNKLCSYCFRDSVWVKAQYLHNSGLFWG